jgi:hypothetical protein
MQYAVKSNKTGKVHAVFARRNPADEFAESTYFGDDGAEVVEISRVSVVSRGAPQTLAFVEDR